MGHRGNMAGKLSSLWGKFTFLEEECEGVSIVDHSLDPLVDRGNSYLVGKLIADWTMPKDIIKLHLIKAWKPTGSVIFRVLGENLFLIDFEHDWDKARVIEGCSWTFDGHLVSLANFDGLTPPSKWTLVRLRFGFGFLTSLWLAWVKRLGCKSDH